MAIPRRLLAAGTGTWLAAMAAVPAVPAPARGRPVPTYVRTRSFATDPDWQARANRRVPGRCQQTSTSYRYRPGSHLVDPGGPPGEIGGVVRRTLRFNAFAQRLPAPVTLDRPFTARFHLRLVNLPSDSSDHRDGGAALIGFLNAAESRGWRTPQSAAMRLNTAGPGKVGVRFEYGTRSYRAGGAVYHDALGHPITLLVNRTYTVQLAYKPLASGGGDLALGIDGFGGVGHLALDPPDRADGATMDRFGVWGQQGRAGDDALSPFLDDVQVDGGPVETFAGGAPGWEPLGVMGESFLDCDTENNQDFGWSGGSGRPARAVGGLIWRVAPSAPHSRAYYADVLARPLTLDDELYAEGDFAVQDATSDSGLLLGWFRHDVDQRGGILPAQTVAMAFTGTSHLGYFVEPQFRARRSVGHLEDFTLPATPRPLAAGWRHFVLHYVPGARGGELRLSVDGHTKVLRVPPEARREGATFDRFGIRDLQAGGHSERVWFDNLTYTFRPGRPRAPSLPAPANRSAPRIAGVARVGRVLSAVPGSWRGRRLTLRHRWERCDPVSKVCSRIPGATGRRYRVRRADVGRALRVVETASNRTTDQVAPSRSTRAVARRRTYRISRH